jgi:hypothetical protein
LGNKSKHSSRTAIDAVAERFMQLLCDAVGNSTDRCVQQDVRCLYTCVFDTIHLQARAAEGDSELDELLSAPRLLLSQFIAKWVAAQPDDVPAMPQAAADKLLLDVSGVRATGGAHNLHNAHHGASRMCGTANTSLGLC